jgi:hypothetical protein
MIKEMKLSKCYDNSSSPKIHKEGQFSTEDDPYGNPHMIFLSTGQAGMSRKYMSADMGERKS